MRAAIELAGDDNFTWDGDYPHPDGTFPWGVEAMLKQPISQDSKRKPLWDNAARVFNLEQRQHSYWEMINLRRRSAPDSYL